MYGSQGIMVDSHPIPEGGVQGWDVVIYYNSCGYRASTDLYPTIDWSMDPLHKNKPVHSNKFNFDSDKIKRIIHLKQSSKFADWGG